jgi:hypothetical protein
MADFAHSLTLRLHVVLIRLLEAFYLVTLMKGAAAAAADLNNDNNFSDFSLCP